MDMIVMQGLKKVFGGNQAIDGLTLSVREGEVFGLVGPDGAGKTTVMRMLAGLMEPTAGTVSICGWDTVKHSEKLKDSIGYMPQRFGLYTDLTVQENLDFYADLYCISRKTRKEKIEELLAFSNMTPFRSRQARNLSGGMKQKLALACVLLHTPKVLLLDEPTNGVDPLSRRDFWRILYRLFEEKVTIFVSTSYMDEAERCSRVGLLHKGRLMFAGTPDEVKKGLRGVLVEIHSQDPRRVLGALRAALAPAAAGLFGTKIHAVFMGEAGQALRAVREMLYIVEPGACAEIVTPTMEDVFISGIASVAEGGDGHDAEEQA